MSRTPPREWLGLTLPLAFAGVLLALAATEAGSAPGGWFVLVIAVAVGLTAPLVYTLVLARRNLLFLRDPAAVARNRERIARFGVPAGWALAVTLFAVGLAFDEVRAILFAGLAGFLLGFWPGLLANFMRLRRENWAPSA